MNIGILQLTQHLDDAVNGFLDGLARHNLNATIHYQNADGNPGLLPKLAHELESIPVDIIFACSTPAAQAAVKLNAPIPVIFTPVFDPVGSGLVSSIPQPNGKATGISGMVDPNAKWQFIQRLLPEIRKLGILYHTGDSNSVLEKNFISSHTPQHIASYPVSIDTATDLSLLPDKLFPDLDALFLPISWLLEENFATIEYYTDLLKLPVIASHGPAVAVGALGGLVANHYDLGFRCAKFAARIANGYNPGLIPVEIAEAPAILLNKQTAEKMGITFSNGLLAEAAEIYE